MRFFERARDLIGLMREAWRAGNFTSSRFGVQTSVSTNARKLAGARHGRDGFSLICASPAGLA